MDNTKNTSTFDRKSYLNFSRNGGRERLAAKNKPEEKAKIKLKVPGFLKVPENAAALKIWKETVKEGSEIGLFENLDASILANYCKYQAMLECELAKLIPDDKKIASCGSMALAYAEKLGLTPSGRARLAVKRANALSDKEKLKNEMIY